MPAIVVVYRNLRLGQKDAKTLQKPKLSIRNIILQLP